MKLKLTNKTKIVIEALLNGRTVEMKASGLENPNACEIKTVWNEIEEDDET